MRERGFYSYYVEAASVTPDEPSPGIYFTFEGQTRGPFDTRQAAHDEWVSLTREPTPVDQDRWAWNHFDPEPGDDIDGVRANSETSSTTSQQRNGGEQR